LEVVIAVGYRVNSKRATQFKIWAVKVLKACKLSWRWFTLCKTIDRQDQETPQKYDILAILATKASGYNHSLNLIWKPLVLCMSHYVSLAN